MCSFVMLSSGENLVRREKVQICLKPMAKLDSLFRGYCPQSKWCYAICVLGTATTKLVPYYLKNTHAYT